LSPKILRVSKTNIDEAVREVSSSRQNVSALKAKVEPIVEDVRRRGDEALFEYALRFDGAQLDSRTVRIQQDEIKAAYESLEPELRNALKKAAENIKAVCRIQLTRLQFRRRLPAGISVALKAVPLKSVGCYVPGGAAAYPSTVLMTTIPARVAGVERVVVCTPSGGDGAVSRAVLAALRIAGVDEAYRVGGAHAIAAMAYGTQSVRPVQKLVGPGGGFVTAAKMLVAGDVAVDMPAGATELIVYGDDGQQAEAVMYELCAQAEHSPDTLVGLVTADEVLASRVADGMDGFISKMARQEIIRKSWEENGFVALCDDVDTALSLIDAIAPEHVALISGRAARLASKITAAGLISTGKHASSALCDYILGVNHVLPTGGYANIRGGLSVLDYVKLIHEVSVDGKTAKRLSRYAATIAEAENLLAHAAAARRGHAA